MSPEEALLNPVRLYTSDEVRQRACPIRSLVLPLNLDQNPHSPFHQKLSALRATQRELARTMPLLGR